MFAHSLRKFSMRDWSIEQKWMSILLPLLLLYDGKLYMPNVSKDNLKINRDYYQSVFGYRQYHVLGIKIVLCEPLVSIIHYFLFPIHDTADTQRHEGNNLFII